MSGSGNKLHITPELFHFVCTDSVQIINDKDEAISMGNDLFGGKSLQSDLDPPSPDSFCILS
ncbi:hypothetical protein C3399_19550 [Enterobacter cloacae complex sp. ECNIH14]|nr:hypothetical protein C3399_19550 [Enterobacter cloacae complex sp. ECNIH14]